MKVVIIVPTLNAGNKWGEWLDMVLAQGISQENIMVIDSSSSDDTAKSAADRGVKVIKIQREEFNHGGTRQLARTYTVSADILVYLTQDAILKDKDSVYKLVEIFNNKIIGAAYGRQLPHINADPLEAFARKFNYRDTSYIYNKEDIPKHKIKTAFLSNSFAAYRVEALNEVGGFPENVIFAEDMVVAAKMLLKGWSVAYVADACVYHSHRYSMIDDFRRYFDMGVLHHREPWLLKKLGRPESEGMRYIYSEINYLLKNNGVIHIPYAILKNIFKYVGYKMGILEGLLPKFLLKTFTSNKAFWINN